MHKNLFIALLLVAFAPVTAHSANPTSPVIVVKRRLINQTAPIPTTTIFTPAHDGVYRLSVYATLTKFDPNSQSNWQLNVNWTDDAGPELGWNVTWQSGSTVGQFYADTTSGGAVSIIEAKAGTSITYTMEQMGPPDNSAYSLYYVLEQIE